jgi:hypothetical protein
MKKASKNFVNPLKEFIITSNKLLFGIKDLFITIKYFNLCFPIYYKEKISTDHEIQ